MTMRNGEILLRAGLIDQLQLRSAMAHQQQWGGRLAHIVVEKRFAREDAVVDALSRALNVPRVELANVEKDAAALAKIDAQYAREKAVFPCALKDGGKTLWIAMADPTDIPTIDDLSLRTRARIRPVIAGEGEIMAAIDLHYLGKSARQPVAFGMIMPAEDFDEEEGKVVDISGRTLIRNINEIRDAAPPQPPPPPPPPASTRTPSRAMDLLDDLMGIGEADPMSAGWTPEQIQRLHMIRDQQEKGARILKAVLDLCIEKGCFRLDEYRARLQRY
jgi:hypothetical protein